MPATSSSTIDGTRIAGTKPQRERHGESDGDDDEQVGERELHAPWQSSGARAGYA
jgi:hypothetical protein